MYEFNETAYEALNQLFTSYGVFCDALADPVEGTLPAVALLDDPYTDVINVDGAIFLLRFRIQTSGRDFTFTRSYGAVTEWDCTASGRRSGQSDLLPPPLEINAYLASLFVDEGLEYIPCFEALKDAAENR